MALSITRGPYPGTHSYPEFLRYLSNIISKTSRSLGTPRILVLLSEATGLIWNMWNMACHIPGHRGTDVDFLSGGIHLLEAQRWLVQSRQYWAPVMLWFLIGCVFPFIVGCIHKPTRQNCTADPFFFSLAKFLLAFIVYSPGAYLDEATGVAGSIGSVWGALLSESSGIVCKSVPGGYRWLLIGPVLCMFSCLYDAALNHSTMSQHPTPRTEVKSKHARKLRSSLSAGRGGL